MTGAGAPTADLWPLWSALMALGALRGLRMARGRLRRHAGRLSGSGRSWALKVWARPGMWRLRRPYVDRFPWYGPAGWSLRVGPLELTRWGWGAQP